jgi:hypothetical protein
VCDLAGVLLDDREETVEAEDDIELQEESLRALLTGRPSSVSALTLFRFVGDSVELLDGEDFLSR